MAANTTAAPAAASTIYEAIVTTSTPMLVSIVAMATSKITSTTATATAAATTIAASTKDIAATAAYARATARATPYLTEVLNTTQMDHYLHHLNSTSGSNKTLNATFSIIANLTILTIGNLTAVNNTATDITVNATTTGTPDFYTTTHSCTLNTTDNLTAYPTDVFSGEAIVCGLVKLEDMWRWVLGGLFLLIFLLGSIQNGIVFVTLSQFAVLDTNTYRIQQCLVLADFFTAVSCGPLNAFQLLYESTITLKYGYEVLLWIQLVLVLVTINITLFISYSRYLYQATSENQLSKQTVSLIP